MLTDCINDALSKVISRDSLKFANITPVHKKEQEHLKIAKTQYKALKIVYNNYESYEELLLRNNEL